MSNQAQAYIYRTKSNYETKAAQEIERFGIPASVPYDESGKRKRVTAPGYVFAERECKLPFARYVHRRIGRVRVGDIARLYVMKVAEVADIGGFEKGDKVMITKGQFAEWPGTIVGPARKGFLVDVVAFGGVRRVSVAAQNLKKIEEPPR